MLDLLKPSTEGLQEYDVSSSTPKAWGDPKHVEQEKPLDDKLPSVVTDAGRDIVQDDFTNWIQSYPMKKRKKHRQPCRG